MEAVYPMYLGTVPRMQGTRQALRAGDDVLVVLPGLGQVRNRDEIADTIHYIKASRSQ